MEIRPLDWEAYIGKKVHIYRNLHNHRMSIRGQVKNKNGKLQWRVVGHITEGLIANVEFRLSEKSRQLAIADDERNVHAWGKGILLGWKHQGVDAPIDLQYDFRHNSTFVERDSQHPIYNCTYLLVRDNKVWCSSDAIKNDGLIVVASRKKRKMLKQVNLLELG